MKMCGTHYQANIEGDRIATLTDLYRSIEKETWITLLTMQPHRPALQGRKQKVVHLALTQSQRSTDLPFISKSTCT